MHTVGDLSRGARAVQRTACLIGFVSVLVWGGCDRTAQGTSGAPIEPATPPARPPSEPVEPLEPDVWDGVCLAHSWEDGGERGYGTESSAEVLDHLQKLGAGWVSLTPFGFMESLESSVVRGEHQPDAQLPRGAERAERVVAVAEQARERGMKSVLKPHIWVRGGEWRGRIRPKTPNREGEREGGGEGAWGAWWDSYEAFIVYWAEVAERAEIESFVVGVELHSALHADADRFLAVIARVRQVYDGEVHYAANWNEPVDERVWAALDAVGVQFYPPLSKSIEAPAAELRAALRQGLDEWSAVAERVDRPLILTEVGYRSALSAATHPNAWPERVDGHHSELDLALQRTLYAILFDEVRKSPNVKGVFVWKYFTDRGTDEEGEAGFSPRGKPAEEVLDVAFGPPVGP